MSDPLVPAPPNAVPACYRHPNQPAGVVCQRCDRPICPQCMHAASVGFHCPECVKQQGQKVYQGAAAFRNRPVLTEALIAVNIVVFVLDQIIKANIGGSRIGWLTFHGGAFGPLVPDDPYRLVTAGFLHANVLHIAFNMYALFVIGRILEPAIGRLRFAAVYGSSLLAGSLGAMLLEPNSLTVGASGAIFGMLGALLVLARQRRATSLVNNLLITLGLNFVITITLPGISKGGHLGGVLGGALCGVVMLEVEKRTRDQRLGAAAIAVVGVVCAVVAFTLMQAKYGTLG